MNPKTKKRVNSLFSMLLALTMMFSSVSMEVFAGGKESGLGDNAAGNNTSGIQTAGGGDFSANITPDATNTGKIGVRFSLVNNANPSEVISVDDEGNPIVLDIVFATWEQWLNIVFGNQLTALTPENEFSSVKTQELMSKRTGGPEIRRMYYGDSTEYYSDISNITEGGSFSVADMAKHPWLIHINEAYHATGEDFVNWCGTDDSGRKVLTDGGNLSTINVFGVRTQVATTEKSGELTVEVENGLDKTEKTFPADNLDEEIEKKLSNLERQIKRMHDSGTEYARTEYNREVANEIYEDFVAVGALIYTLENKGDASAPSYRTRYETYYNDMEGLFTDFHSGFNSFKVDYVANRCNAAGIDFNPGTGNEALGKLDNYGNENAGTPSEEGTEQSRLSQIHKILALKDKNTGSYILQTKSMIEKNCSIGGATEDWVLLVEPIVYLSICKGNSEGRIKDVVPGTTKLYGTVSNVMDAFMSIPNLRGYANRQTFNYKAMKEWWQALTVRDDTETGGFKFGNGDTLVYPTRYDAVPLAFGSYYHPAVLSNSNRWVEKGDHREKSGWGVNVYWGKNISNSDGRSWDGTSPDPGPPPEHEEKDATIKVVKWYTTYYKDGEKTYQIVTDVFVGSKQSRKIFAENEGIPGQGSFYLLEKWATGKDETI